MAAQPHYLQCRAYIPTAQDKRGRRIFVGYDASTYADTALRRAVDFSGEGDLIKVEHIPNIGDQSRTLQPGASNSDEIIGKAKRTVWSHLDDTKRDLVKEGVKMEYEVDEGTRDIKTAIIKASQRNHSDIIVIAARGMPSGIIGKASKLLTDLLGSIPDYLVHNASCDVVVAKPMGRAPGRNRKYMVGYDGSQYSDVAVRRVLDYMPNNSKFRIVHIPNVGDKDRTVMPGQTNEWQIIDKAKKLVENHCTFLNRDLEKDGIEMEYIVAQSTSDIKVAMIMAVEEFNADQLFIASRGVPEDFLTAAQQKLKDLLGSIPDYLVHNAPCDVVVVKPRSKYYQKERKIHGEAGKKDYGW